MSMNFISLFCSGDCSLENYLFGYYYPDCFFSSMQVLQGLAKSIASDGEGATCLVEVRLS